MSGEEIDPEVVAMRERWKDASDTEVLDAYDRDEIMDADTMRRGARLWQRREESAEGVLRFPLGRYYKKNAGTDIFVHDIGYIQMSPDRRALCEDSVVKLMESIRKIGLLHPPIVMRRDGVIIDGEAEDNVPVLIAGRHRIEAWRRLGHSKIACLEIRDVSDIEAEMIEIGENLHRAELTQLQHDEQVARWIELTATKREAEAQTVSSAQYTVNAVTGKLVKVGSDPDILRQPDAKPGRPEGGVRAAARELGLSEPDARRAVKVASLSPQAKAAAVEAGLDNNRSALLAAAKESDPEKQVEVIAARLKREPPLPKQELIKRARDFEEERRLGGIVADSESGELALLLVEHLPAAALRRAREILTNERVVKREMADLAGTMVTRILRDLDALMVAPSSDNFAPPVRTPIGREWEQDEAA